MPSKKVNAIAVDPVTPQNVYLAGPGGLFRSADGGVTLEVMPVELNSEPLALTLDPHTPTTLFVLLADGALWKSEDAGKTWAALGMK